MLVVVLPLMTILTVLAALVSLLRTRGVDDKPHKSLEEMLPLLKTGDIVLMCGVGMGGAVIRVMDRAKYSHVGIIVRDPWIDCPCVWESTGNSAGVFAACSTPLGQTLHLCTCTYSIYANETT